MKEINLQNFVINAKKLLSNKDIDYLIKKIEELKTNKNIEKYCMASKEKNLINIFKKKFKKSKSLYFSF